MRSMALVGVGGALGALLGHRRIEAQAARVLEGLPRLGDRLVLDVIPLFETGDDLARCVEVLDEGGVAVRVEIRSVNHRHLQIKSRLPGELVATVLQHLHRDALASLETGLVHLRDRGGGERLLSRCIDPLSGTSPIQLSISECPRRRVQPSGRSHTARR